ncbi:MAG: ABC-F family ATP-binding cassette domain-containing protein [Bacteroidota bacterium]|nr:ABC-F family ATP-binding cassette domain-containing protein [Bacteroidota bacterium]
MFSVNKISISFSGTPLFSDVSFVVGPKERLGLTGKNGAGKSTILKMMKGLIEFDSGSIDIPSGKTTGYLPQKMRYASGKTVFNETREAFSKILKLTEREQEITNQLTKRTDYDSDSYLQLADDLSKIQEQFKFSSAEKMEADIEKTLKGLGFERKDFDRQVTEFSGGWRMRIELAKILLKKPNLLLLDEPTNHLDIESIQWLESFLESYSGAVIVISHDRKFLDALTQRTIEIAGGTIYDYNMPFSKFEHKRKERLVLQKAEYDNQQKIIRDTEAFINRFRYQANKASQVQSRVKQLDKLEKIKFDEEDFSNLEFSFPDPPRSGDIVFEAKDLSMAYDTENILEHLYFTIERGNRIALAGKNGQGKTTMVRIIIGELEHEGFSKIGQHVNIGYFAQNQDEKLDDRKTVFETLDEVAVGDVRKRLRDILGQFLFQGENVDKKVAVLSGGERSRLALAKLMLEPYNLLILDEPTNHLDIRSKDRLKKALQQYPGSLIVVSHDRDFLDGLVDSIYEFDNKSIKKHSGDLRLYLKKIKEKQNDYSKAKSNENSGNIKVSDTKQLYLLRKEADKEIRKFEKKIKETEKEIETNENYIEEAEELMKLGEHSDDPDFFEKFEQAKQFLDKHMKLWENLNEQIIVLEEKKEKLV